MSNFSLSERACRLTTDEETKTEDESKADGKNRRLMRKKQKRQEKSDGKSPTQ